MSQAAMTWGRRGACTTCFCKRAACVSCQQPVGFVPEAVKENMGLLGFWYVLVSFFGGGFLFILPAFLENLHRGS